MLKISVIDSGLRRRLVVEGELIAPWISELRTAWKMANRELQSRELTIDIANITLISQEGENTLLELMNEGAVFRCRGVLMKHVLRQLMRRTNTNSRGTIGSAKRKE